MKSGIKQRMTERSHQSMAHISQDKDFRKAKKHRKRSKERKKKRDEANTKTFLGYKFQRKKKREEISEQNNGKCRRTASVDTRFSGWNVGTLIETKRRSFRRKRCVANISNLSLAFVSSLLYSSDAL
jgi:hypothetical protein